MEIWAVYYISPQKLYKNVFYSLAYKRWEVHWFLFGWFIMLSVQILKLGMYINLLAKDILVSMIIRNKIYLKK